MSSNKSVKAITTEVAKIFGVARTAIMSDTRENQEVAFARQVAMYVHNYRNRCTKRATAKAFDRAPPTVTHSLGVIVAKMKRNKAFREQIKSLTA